MSFQSCASNNQLIVPLMMATIRKNKYVAVTVCNIDDRIDDSKQQISR
jgi:hypothetical protein